MILHLDLDSFFVSAHRTRDLSLLNKPVAVGGRSNLKIFERKSNNIQLYDTNHGAFVNPIFYNQTKQNFNTFFVDKQKGGKSKVRGIITTSSYEARSYGIKTGMPVAQALNLCPSLIVIPPDYLLYHDLSHRLHSYLMTMLPIIEQYSIDEFFADLNGWIGEDDVYAFIVHLQRCVMDRFNLPVSIGVSSGKWIAKLATNFAKPYGVKIVYKHEIPSFIREIPIKDFPGIGKGYAKRLEKYFITTLGEASCHKELFDQWGKTGKQLYLRLIGKDDEGILFSSDRKSIGISRTFDPLYDRLEVSRRIIILARHVVFLVFRQKVNPTSYYLKLKYDFGSSVKGRVTLDRLFSESLCIDVYRNLFSNIDIQEGHVTKISISVSNFSLQNKKTFSLIHLRDDLQEKKLSESIHTLREKYSLDIVKFGSEL